MRRVIAVVVKVLVFELVIGLVLFGSAGRLDLPWFWALIAVHAIGLLAGQLAMDPGLDRERLNPAPGGPAGKEYFFRIGGTIAILAHLAVAGLDVGRFHWSVPPPTALRVVALVVYAAGLGFGMWAIVTNRFFSSVVRLQSDRGHHVVDTGPYRFVRHPGYAGMMVSALSGSVVLGSWWSAVPMLLFGGMLVRRLTMEDRFLNANLDGYRAYAGRVRSKVLPGVW
jgi:protein-S-isoprenylcysteine O-methyltransferase Ste14